MNIAIVYDDKSKEIIKTKDIQYIEPRSKGTIVRSADDTYYSKDAMIKWEENLSNQPFSRCHKSYIVNLMYVNKIHKGYAELHSGERVMISRRKHKEFKQRLNKYVGKSEG